MPVTPSSEGQGRGRAENRSRILAESWANSGFDGYCVEIEQDGLRKWGCLIYVPRPSQARRPGRDFGYAKLAELADALDSGSSGVTLVGVQVPRFAPGFLQGIVGSRHAAWDLWAHGFGRFPGRFNPRQ